MESRVRIPATAHASLSYGASLGTSRHGQSVPVLSARALGAAQGNAVNPVRREIEEVEGLTTWNSLSPTELLAHQQEAEMLSHYRSQYTEIDNFFMQRKTRSSLPALSSRPSSDQQLKHILEITKRRAQKQDQEKQYKELAKFSKRYEEDLTAKATELKAQLEEVEEQREVLRRRNTVLREKLTESDLAIKAYRMSSNRQENVLKSKMKSLRSEDLSYVFSKRSACQLELVTKEQDYQETILRLTHEITANSTETAALDEKVRDARSKLKNVHRSLVEHYRKILAEGLDTRSEGLAWVVKALWALDQKVEAEMFPPFLDLESVHVIIFVAQKSLEIEELSQYISQVQNTTRLSLISLSRSSCAIEITDRLSALKRPIRTAYPVVAKPLFADNSALPNSTSRVDTEEPVSPAMNQTKPMEDRVNGLKAVIHSALEQELRRLAKDCFMNNLEQRAKVSARQMLAAIAGSEALGKIMPVITKEQKELADELRRSKTFSFATSAH